MSSRWVRGLVWSGAVLLGMAAVNAEVARRVDPLDPAGPLSGDTDYYQWSLGRVSYTVKGQGHPVVLVHGVGIGADRFEWRRVFNRFSEMYRVYAYDQLGFGLSDRPDVTYQPELYVRLLRDFLRDIVHGAATVVASGLAGAHAVVAASLYPTLFEHLVLLHPTGARGELDSLKWERRLVHTVLRSPVVGELLVNLLASRSSIRERLYEHWPSMSESEFRDMIEACYASSHQPGARHAIAAYLTGFLDVDVRRHFASLSLPTVVVWGGRALPGPLDGACFSQDLNPRSRATVFEGAGSDLANARPDELVMLIKDLLQEGAKHLRHD